MNTEHGGFSAAESAAETLQTQHEPSRLPPYLPEVMKQPDCPAVCELACVPWNLSTRV